MQSRIISGITVVFDSSEQDTAELICDATANVLRLIQESWGWGRPEDCRIYVMTSWWGFFFQSAPWFWRLLLTKTFPLWCFPGTADLAVQRRLDPTIWPASSNRDQAATPA